MNARLALITLLAPLTLISTASDAGSDDATFLPLGHVPGSTFSQATSVSNDGQFVGGHSATDTGFAPIIWDGTSPNELTIPAGFEDGGAYVNAISGDGQSAVAIGPGPAGFRGIRWAPSGTPHILETAPGTFSSFNAINYDGTAAGGFTNQDLFTMASDAVIWTSEDGEIIIGDLPGGNHEGSMTAVSDDGLRFAGYGSDSTVRRPVTWTADTGYQVLPDPDGSPATGLAIEISSNGSVVVGALEAGMNTTPAFWIDGGNAQTINLWEGYAVGEAADVVDDGSIVVGQWRETSFSDELGSLAFIWDAENGARPLQDVLADEYGIDVADWTLNTAAAITPDGLTIAGAGVNPEGNLEAYKVHLPGKQSIPGDLDGSGAVDGADLAILLGEWGVCPDCDDCAADLDGNCEVDGADLAILLGNWR